MIAGRMAARAWLVDLRGRVMGEQDRREDQHAELMAGWHGASATGPAQPQALTRRQARRRSRVRVLIGGLFVTAVSVVFIASFIGALHNPGPRSVPLAFAGSQAQASTLRNALAHQAPGGFKVTAYPTETAARNAIIDRKANAALVPAPRGSSCSSPQRRARP